MRTTTFFLFSVLFAFSTFAQNYKAAKYNDKIILIQHKITSKLAKFASSIGRTPLEKLHNEKDDIEIALSKAIKKVETLDAFEGDIQLRDASIEWFKLTKKILEKDFDEVMHILTKHEKSEIEKQELKDMMNKLVSEEDEIILKFEKAQEEFASRHRLELVEVPIKL